MDSAADALRYFYEDLQMIKFGLSFNISDFLIVADVIMDSWVAGCLVRRQVGKALKECDSALRSVESIRDKLISMLPDEYKK